MWCGFACPQTVWTDLMIVVERFWQGDRAARIRLDKSRVDVREALEEDGNARLVAAHRASRPAARSSSISAMRPPSPTSW